MIWNDLKKNKLMSFTIIIFMTVVACMFSLTMILSVYLTGSIENLMTLAGTPGFLQMHSGELHRQQLEDFSQNYDGIDAFQVCEFLNLNNADIFINGHSLSGSTQDNGVCVQSDSFDYLLDMNNQKPKVKPGEIYVPVCYMQEYGLDEGMELRVGDAVFVIAGFIRDSQMNSMMASSKRFLVCRQDYERLQQVGKEEYLIEFLLDEDVDLQVFSTDYADAGLDGNGPTITASLVRMMNALSDGVVIFIILFVSVLLLLIAILCIRFSVLTKLEKDKREIGTLKALGISKRDIRILYFAKYLLLAFSGLVLGLSAAFVLQERFIGETQELYGAYHNSGWMAAAAAAGAVMALGMVLGSVWRTLKRTQRLSVTEAINGRGELYRLSVRKQYFMIGAVLALCVGMILIPENMASTLSSEKFAAYMGIGDGQIRIDINQTEQIYKKTRQLEERLAEDSRVENYAVLQTQNYKRLSPEGEWTNLTVEQGQHTVFPVAYSRGKAPEEEGEIALSYLNTEDMGVTLGDRLVLRKGSLEKEYEICGIYSDITNGGKSAKLAAEQTDEEQELMWSVIYLSLKEGTDAEVFMSDMHRQMRELGMDADVVEVETYIKATYGTVILQMQKMAGLILLAAVVIIAAVTVLFVRLVIEKERFGLSLHKALGYTTGEVKYQYYRNYLLCAAAAAVVGIGAGTVLGELAVGSFLHSLGADGFSFIIDPAAVFIRVPGIMLLTVGAAVFAGTAKIKEIKAYECCKGRE